MQHVRISDLHIFDYCSYPRLLLCTFIMLCLLKEIGTIKRFYSVYGVYYVLLHFIQSSVITKCGFIPEKRS